MSTDQDLQSDSNSTDNLLRQLVALRNQSEQDSVPSAKTRAELPESFGAWRQARSRRIEQQISLFLDAAE